MGNFFLINNFNFKQTLWSNNKIVLYTTSVAGVLSLSVDLNMDICWKREEEEIDADSPVHQQLFHHVSAVLRLTQTDGGICGRQQSTDS